MIKWIGGATGAVLLALGGATLAGEYMKDAPPAPAEKMASNATLEQAIPVNEAAIEGTLDADKPDAEKAVADESTEGDVQIEQAVATEGDATLTEAADKAPKKKPAKFVVKRILDIDGPLKYGDWYWDTKGVPDGPIVITVDLQARVISVFRDGYEIGAAVAMLGTKKHPTPVGTFPILWKQRHNVSEKYNNAPMPWSMFLTRSGVAIHGGSVVENGYASHGCIAIPDELASRLFAIAKKGDKVIITDGKTLELGDKII